MRLGLGCHPQVPAAVAAFDADRLAEAVARAPLIGEVGLDGGSKVPMVDQRRVFRAALEVSQQQSRLVSIHSTRASGAVLRELESVGGVPGAILHWWRGSPAETKRAIALGCYFSLNGAEAARPKVSALVPVDRVLTETDFPHTRRADKTADRPGAVRTIEGTLAEEWSLSLEDVRRQLWKNLAQLCATTRTSSLMPRAFKAASSRPAEDAEGYTISSSRRGARPRPARRRRRQQGTREPPADDAISASAILVKLADQ